MNWDPVRDEAIRHLQALLRIDTSNPPGNELAAAEYVAKVLSAEGLSALVLKSAPARGSVLTRLTGSGERPPLMMMGHLDVVPAKAEEWTHPPFSGDLTDGFVWGRGALDCKGVVVSHLMVTLLLHRLGLPLRGDVMHLAHADEESDFTYGLAWLAREHSDLLNAPYALYEGAGDEIDVAGKRIQTIAVAEKGWCTIEVTTHGEGGHSSVPHINNPLFHMAPVLTRLQQNKMPVHLTKTTTTFFQRLSEELERTSETKQLFRQIAEPETADAALRQLPVSEAQRIWFDAMLRNTVAPTMMQGSNSPWALPAQAKLTLNGRVLPGQSQVDFNRELSAILGPEADYRVEGFHAGIESSIDSPLYDSIQRVMARGNPGVPVLPVLMTGGTERYILAELGIDCYSFWPRRLEPGLPPLRQMAHGVDERVSVDNLLFGIQCLFEIVCDMNGIER